jgi:glutaconyl-CoA decarboxylase
MKYKVTLNGKVYEVEVEKGNAILTDEYEAAVPVAAPVAAAPVAAAPAAAAAPVAAPAAAPVAVGAGETVNAPLPGNNFSIKVSAGQAVKKGDILVIIEAMKMENEVLSPRDGTVSQVVVTNGASVDTGAPLVVLA